MFSGMQESRRVVFVLLPHVHLLDLAGPAQVFYEAAEFGAPYQVVFVGARSQVVSSPGLVLARIGRLPEPRATDLVIVPGLDSTRLVGCARQVGGWLRDAHAAGARIASVCSGAFALGEAGLLDGRTCTTHWKVIDRLQRDFPAARVLDNRLFVSDGQVVTSAGVASGIDMALALLEEDTGPLMLARVCKEMVVYLRRSGSEDQRSVFVEYRSHLHRGIHQVQDFIVANPDETPSLTELGRIAGMSPRNLTRSFRASTGVTLKHYMHDVKLEVARNLMSDPTNTLDDVARRCGFDDPRQLRRLWKRLHGVSPSRWRQSEGELR